MVMVVPLDGNHLGVPQRISEFIYIYILQRCQRLDCMERRQISAFHIASRFCVLVLAKIHQEILKFGSFFYLPAYMLISTYVNYASYGFYALAGCLVSFSLKLAAVLGKVSNCCSVFALRGGGLYLDTLVFQCFSSFFHSLL